MAKQTYRLTPDDLLIFKRASQENPSYFTSYYLGGWEFFDYQLAVHLAAQPDITFIAGVGAGKTATVGISAATWAAMCPYFKFMNVAPTSWQSELMYKFVLQHAESNRYNRFINNAVKRPYPSIALYNGSVLEFMSAADEIERVRGWEGDWMNGDEFGYIDSPATIRYMRTRLRGRRPVTKNKRLGRLSVTTTATDAPWLWERYDLAKVRPERYLSITATTEMNKSLSPEDAQRMREALPEELQAIEMEGQRPMGTCEEFSRAAISGCEDRELNHFCKLGIDDGEFGYSYREVPSVGCVEFMMPPDRGREYLVIGDPGQGNPPLRNSPVVLVWDITGFPESPIVMRSFKWVYGNGSYMPFLATFEEMINQYRPVAAAFDSTGTQKAMDELAMSQIGGGLIVEGMNLAGQKLAFHNAIKMMMHRGLVKYPFIRGMRTQMAHYKFPDTKLSQDIVSALQITGGWLRRRFFDQIENNERRGSAGIHLHALDRNQRLIQRNYGRP